MEIKSAFLCWPLILLFANLWQLKGEKNYGCKFRGFNDYDKVQVVDGQPSSSSSSCDWLWVSSECNEKAPSSHLEREPPSFLIIIYTLVVLLLLLLLLLFSTTTTIARSSCWLALLLQALLNRLLPQSTPPPQLTTTSHCSQCCCRWAGWANRAEPSWAEPPHHLPRHLHHQHQPEELARGSSFCSPCCCRLFRLTMTTTRHLHTAVSVLVTVVAAPVPACHLQLIHIHNLISFIYRLLCTFHFGSFTRPLTWLYGVHNFPSPLSLFCCLSTAVAATVVVVVCRTELVEFKLSIFNELWFVIQCGCWLKMLIPVKLDVCVCAKLMDN